MTSQQNVQTWAAGSVQEDAACSSRVRVKARGHQLWPWNRAQWLLFNQLQTFVKELAVPVPAAAARWDNETCALIFINSSTDFFSNMHCGQTGSEWQWQITDWQKWLAHPSALWDVAFVAYFLDFTLNITIWEVDRPRFPFFGANFAIYVSTFITAPPLGATKWVLGAVSTRLLYPDMLPQLQYLAFARKDNTPWI